jgi:hypothetical protein
MLPINGQSCYAASVLCKQQLELAMGPAMRARSVRAIKHATDALQLKVSYAVLRAVQAAVEAGDGASVGAGDGASDAGTICARY